MPSKSDSAGKLHQFYTCQHLKLIYPNAICSSPLNDMDHREIHQNSFESPEIISLEQIGMLSANLIANLMKGELITRIEDIGVSSGAIGIENTDDLIITNSTGNKLGFSLKCAKGISQILSKNMGAKSLLTSYFNAPIQQEVFNNKMNKSYLIFLNSILNSESGDLKEIKDNINNLASDNKLSKARFSDSIFPSANDNRNIFLNSLRNELFDILKHLDKKQLSNACNLILDTGKNHIIADYSFNKERALHITTPIKNENDVLSIDKRGNDSVTITTNDYIIGFRYKFESGITSSIKLVGDYKKIV